MPSVDLRRVRKDQRGYAMILVLVFMVMGSLTYLVKSASRIEALFNRDAITQSALAKAKEALIAWSSEASQGPGHMICPDDDNDGDVDSGSCTATPATRIGRLPYKTLRIPILRDSSGEVLWYALSKDFNNHAGKIVNSETPGTLTVTGLSPSQRVIAIVFAPGASLSGQSREIDPALLQASPDLLAVSNYLEGENAELEEADEFEARPKSGTFNDQLIVIREEDLYPAAERAVAARMAAMLRYYRDQWAASTSYAIYPYAAPANPHPSTSPDDACGVVTMDHSEGFVPVSRSDTCAHWVSNLEVLNDGGGRLLSSSACARDVAANLEPVDTDRGKPLSTLICTLNYDAGTSPVDIEIRVALNNGFGSLAMPVDWTDIEYGNAPTYSDPAIGKGGDNVIVNGDTLLFRYRAELPVTGGTKRIVIPIYSLLDKYPLPDDETGNWFVDSQWFRLTYYAAGRGTLSRVAMIGCTPIPCSKLSVTGWTPITNDKDAILIVAGAALATQTRPASTLIDYWDLENADDATDRIFAKQARSASFNDYAYVIAP